MMNVQKKPSVEATDICDAPLDCLKRFNIYVC